MPSEQKIETAAVLVDLPVLSLSSSLIRTAFVSALDRLTSCTTGSQRQRNNDTGIWSYILQQ